MANHDCIGPLLRAGISYEDALALRRIAMTLHRWHEMECGINDGCVEREEKWAIERAAWPASDRDRWWNGAEWARSAFRRTYSDEERADLGVSIPRDAAFRETGCKPLWRNSYTMRGTVIPDREAGAKKRLAAIMENYPRFSVYIQGDPRGAALYILRPGDVPQGEAVDAYYSRGLAVHK